MSRLHAPPAEELFDSRLDEDVLARWAAVDQTQEAIWPAAPSSGPAEEPLDSKVCWPC